MNNDNIKKALFSIFFISSMFLFTIIIISSKFLWLMELNTKGVGHNFWSGLPLIIWIFPTFLLLLSFVFLNTKKS